MNDQTALTRIAPELAKERLLAAFSHYKTIGAVARYFDVSSRTVARWIADLSLEFPRDKGGRPRTHDTNVIAKTAGKPEKPRKV